MMNRLQNTNWVDLEHLNDTLALNGKALLNRVVQELHTQFQSQFSAIVEWHSRPMQVRVTAIASSDIMPNQPSDPQQAEDTLFMQAAIDCSQAYTQQYRLAAGQHSKHPNECTQHQIQFHQHNVTYYFVAVPLKSRSGELSGVLLSAFINEPEALCEHSRHHLFYANIIKHSLREKWSSDRSDVLVNQLSHQVSHDSLTDLLNRSCLSDTLETLTHSGTPFSLSYLDIDNFKLVNDVNGSYIGDQIIKFTAQTLSQTLPKSAMIFRVAGDEFAFIVFDEDPINVAEHVLNKLNCGYQDHANHIYFTVSVGVVPCAKHHLSSDELIHNANLALKECKKQPERRIQYYDNQLSRHYQRKTQLIEALRSQLQMPVEESEIFVAVQPIVHVGQERWYHFEVLARWSSLKYGFVSPLEFIQVAEQSGLIVPLGDRIIELACIAKQKLEQELGYRVTLSINCSALELTDSARYVENLNTMMVKYHHLPEDFVIELTESVLLPQINHGDKVLESLRYLGFKVALDDFGTGYSSLNYIQSYPIDTIKIDASFVRNMLTHETSERVISLIVQLAQHLKVDLVAEGVEDKQALNKLVAMGCNQIQGYYFSKPHKPLDMIELIKHQAAKRA